MWITSINQYKILILYRDIFYVIKKFRTDLKSVFQSFFEKEIEIGAAAWHILLLQICSTLHLLWPQDSVMNSAIKGVGKRSMNITLFKTLKSIQILNFFGSHFLGWTTIGQPIQTFLWDK